MANARDEAILRIIVDDKGVTQAPTQSPLTPEQQKSQAQAILGGTAQPWAPRSQPIPAPAGMGVMSSDQSEWIRLEAESARRGMSVHEYRKSEVAAKRAGGTTSPPDPAASLAPTIPPSVNEGMRVGIEDVTAQAPASATTVAPEPVKTDPLPVEVIKAPEIDLTSWAAAVADIPKLAELPLYPPPEPEDEGEYQSYFDSPEYKAQFPEPEEEYQSYFDSPEYKSQFPPTAQFAPPESIAPPPPVAQFAPPPLPEPDDPSKNLTGKEKRIAELEGYNPQPDSPAAKELARLKGEDKKKPSFMDTAIGILDPMRGSIGGIFGPVAGAAVDVAKGFHNMQKEQEKLEEGASQVGAAMMLAAPAVGAVVVAFGALTAALDASVERYAEFSPEIAQAQADVEIRRMGNDMRRSAEHGAELARYVESQGRMQEKFEETKMRILVKLAPIIESIFDTLGILAEGVGILSNLGDLLSPLGAMSEAIRESVSMQRDDKAPEPSDPTSVLFEDMNPALPRDWRGVRVPEE